MAAAVSGTAMAGAVPTIASDAPPETTAITGSLPDGDVGLYAVPLADGGALVLAGGGGGGSVDTLFHWRPGSDGFERAGDLLESRLAPAVVSLPGGDVLISGGFDADGRALATIERWSPERGQTGSAGSLAEARAAHSGTLLPDGRVLLVGGLDAIADEMTTIANAEVWDSANGEAVAAGSLNEPRYGHTATALPDGRVAIIGGVTFTTAGLEFAESIELWSPDDGTFTTVGQYPRHAANHSATLLDDGRVLVVGGITAGGAEVSDDVETWDPASGTVTPEGTLSDARTTHTATLLDNGSVIVIGGQGLEGPLATAEVWDSATGIAEAPVDLVRPRSTHATAALPDGRLLVVGGFGDGEYLSSYEVWPIAPDRSQGEGRDAAGSSADTTLGTTQLDSTGGDDAKAKAQPSTS